MGEKKENTPCLRDRNGLTEEEFLKSYNPGHYARPSVAADMAIFTVTDQEESNYRKLPEKNLSILLIQRGGHPYLGCWALPGGFVRPEKKPDWIMGIWNSCTRSVNREGIPEPGS